MGRFGDERRRYCGPLVMMLMPENRYLDREYVRRLADTSLRIYAYNLLHFVRWWESVHHTGDIQEGDLSESTLLEYGICALPVRPTTSAVSFHHQ